MYLPTRAAKTEHVVIQYNASGMSWLEAEYAGCICLLKTRKCLYALLLIVQNCCDGHQSMHAWLVQGTMPSQRHLFYSTLLDY